MGRQRLPLLLVFLGACGGSDKGTGPGDVEPPNGDPGRQTSGRVFLDNRTAYGVEVAYLNTQREDEPRIVRTVIEAGATGDIGQEVLPGGVEVEFDLVLLIPPEEGFRVRRKAQILIDGDVVLQMRLEIADDPFSVLIE